MFKENVVPLDIISYLESFPKETVYYCPNPGNAGDALIASATYQLFDRCGVIYDTISENIRAIDNLDFLKDKIVMYGGGGNFVKYYKHAAIALERLHSVAKKLIILPHTISGHEVLLKGFGSHVDLICREEVSFQYVQSVATDANVFLAEDLAIHLDIEELFGRVYCNDFIYPTRIYWKRAWAQIKKRLACFRVDDEKTSLLLPIDNIDLSALYGHYINMGKRLEVDEVSYHFLHFIQAFSEIRTNRLHAAIGAALLGKKVYFYPNSYHKNESIYRYSLQEKFPHVKWRKN